MIFVFYISCILNRKKYHKDLITVEKYIMSRKLICLPIVHCINYQYILKIHVVIIYSILEAKAFTDMHPVCNERNHLTASYLYIRAENSSTACTNILRGICKML